VREEAAEKPQGLLSIVATPIGNLEDITLRALRILRESDRILAEDTRRTRILCTHHGITRPLRALHAHSSPRELARALDDLLRGEHLALVTDAGTPLISDPGAELVRAARERGIAVQAIPGASAVLAALSVSGLACDTFRFLGFLPRSGRRRQTELDALRHERAATVLFESPQRLRETLDDLARVLPTTRSIAVCRELTKLHEEVARGSALALAGRFADGARGEITLVIEGHDPDRDIEAQRELSEAGAEDDAALDARIRAQLESGLSVRDVVKLLSATSQLPRKALYARVQASKAALTVE
jgi:16S rRNA (cytidine1402-2'-O)-methyltransferase